MKKFPNIKYIKAENYYKDYRNEHDKVFNNLSIKNLNKVIKIIKKKYLNGKKVFVCGNGGSAALANHFACDHQKILSSIKKLKPRLYSLCSNIPLITAISNDKKYEDVFSDQIISHGSKGDLLICISSSGNSKNIIKVIKTSKKIGIYSLSLTGFSGGLAKKKSNINIHCASKNYGIIESVHHSIMNIIAQFIRNSYLSKTEIQKINF
jgi:phosphoheptose isomerase